MMSVETSYLKAFQLTEEELFKIDSRIAQLEAAGVSLGVPEYMGCSGCLPGDKRVGMVLTHKCQLHCSYCYEGSRNSESMNPETAIRILKQELSQLSETSRMHIDLFGGEPFLAFDLMKVIVDYLESCTDRKRVCITTITNGVAIHGEIQDWLLSHRDVIECPLSIDGPREVQEITRPHSFDRLDLDFFEKKLPGTRAKMTVSPETMDKLAESTIFLHRKKFAPKNGLAYGTTWHKDSSIILTQQLEILIRYYLDNPEINESLMLQLPARDICVRRRSCDAGGAMCIYDTDGSRWPCHMFLPIAVGSISTSQIEKMGLPLDPDVFLTGEEECGVCPIRNSCVICRGITYSTDGTLAGYDKDICVLNKIIYKAKACLAFKKWQLGIAKMHNSQDEMLTLSAIKRCLQLC